MTFSIDIKTHCHPMNVQSQIVTAPQRSIRDDGREMVKAAIKKRAMKEVSFLTGLP